MKVAFELTGEHPTVPRAEAATLAAAAGAELEPGRPGSRTLVADGCNDARGLADRLAMTRRIVRLEARCELDVDAILRAALAISVGGRRFQVRCSRLDPAIDPRVAVEVQRRLGGQLERDGVVDLDAPDVTVRVLLGDEVLVGRELAVVDRAAFEARHVEERAHFSPISLHPRLARALVNLTGVAPGQRIWDPFVGTGGLLLEAALVGCEAIGSDLDQAMVNGTRATLQQYGCGAEVVEGDVNDVASRLAPVEAIVTDPPYGRASSTHREDVATLYERFFAAAHDVLSPGGRVVCVLPREKDVALALDRFELVERHDWYVHGSLTRHICVLDCIDRA